ncbi:hypothetical protein [Acidovorax sp.]|jgi:hypothetical protein|uniref:hypothetical protein n=1 Tax=Acidovorax sp. TaxID=1872122 RepID=UPI00391FA563
MPIPAFTPARYRATVRASAWYDLLVTWPFALPWTFAWLYGLLASASTALALPGTMHPLDATHMLLANLLGSVVVVWSIARIAAPGVLLGRLDGLARFLFAAWQIYAVAHGASAIVLGFTVFELFFGVLQWWRVAGAGGAACPAKLSARVRAAA